MSEERRKTNKHCTGTVPKIKHRNTNGRDSLRSLPNNLAFDPARLLEIGSRNSSSETGRTRFQMEPPLTNGTGNTNGSGSNNSSSSASRRNSMGNYSKCDNISKYPDKKQIEDKLSQIQEYLRLTTCLMSSMKNNDDQPDDPSEYENIMKMISDLKDSELKLLEMLKNINNTGQNSNEQDKQVAENTSESVVSERLRLDTENREIELLREQQVTLQNLQQQAERKLRIAREAQDKLYAGKSTKSENASGSKQNKNMTVLDFDDALTDLEERTKRLNASDPSGMNARAKMITDEIDSLQNEISVMHNANDDRNQLIQMLDKRDAELRSQHVELQSKLSELQTRKNQVDQLVTQITDLDETEEDGDVGCQVRRIVTMKDQLAKLKDMLEMVQTAEAQGTHLQNGQLEFLDDAQDFISAPPSDASAYNKQVNRVASLPSAHDNNLSLHYDNRAAQPHHHDNRNKEVNKNSRESKGALPKPASSFAEKLALQAELKAKKRELEEIMGKHKASTSNLNHDVGIDNKSEFSCSNSLFDNASETWAPLLPVHHNSGDSDHYSSDDGAEDVNEYTEIPTNHSLPIPSFNYSRENSCKRGPPSRNSQLHAQHYEVRMPSVTPDRIRRGDSANSTFSRVSNAQQNKNQSVQKQLELIRSVCDSMLSQQGAPAQPTQLRNNLTPSPEYNESRRYHSPHANSMNAINLVTPTMPFDINPPMVPWMNAPNNAVDMANYQNLMATNALQTQAFVLNTLNQCCQMLWMQQRELTALRSTVTSMQHSNMDSPQYPISPSQSLPRPSDHYPHPAPPNPAHKPHVSSASSLPNLNHYPPPHANVDAGAFNTNMPPLQCLNNTTGPSVPNINNSVLHASVNQLSEGHVWNGQALNNQVPPGNRANNYWDNFRSYSRQNLLSTKSNEGFQNVSLATERTHNRIERPSSQFLLPHSKSNSEQGSAASSHHNTPRRSTTITSRRYPNSNIAVVPPDVLNINQNTPPKSEELPASFSNEEDEAASSFNSNLFANTASGFNFNHEFLSGINDSFKHTHERKNEWHDDYQNEEVDQKVKLFEDLRENVYKEVASLISANETRPDFLIQLFRDLQLISSDPLRLKTLQSIQVLITQSIQASQPSNLNAQNERNFEQLESGHEAGASGLGNISLQSTVWSCAKTSQNARNPSILENMEPQLPDEIFFDIIPFLNDHEHEIVYHQLLMELKEVIMQSKSFKERVTDKIFQKHFSNILDEFLVIYLGKQLNEVKMPLLENLRNLLQRELSFINLIQVTSTRNESMASNAANYELQSHAVSNTGTEATENNTPLQEIDNEDLAEADQSHLEDEGLEDEGAVGGFLDVHCDSLGNVANSIDHHDIEYSAILDFPQNVESESQFQLGLDQVPTRLPTNSRSRSITPNKERASSRQDQNDQF